MSVVVESRRPAGIPFSVILLEVIPAALVVLLLAAVGVVHVTSRVLVVKMGYELSRLDAEAATLTRENDALKVELATLNSPSRLETLAHQKLGMGPPAPGTVVHLKPK